MILLEAVDVTFSKMRTRRSVLSQQEVIGPDQGYFFTSLLSGVRQNREIRRREAKEL